MTRIAIAGSGGLAQHIAHFLKQSSHCFVILSRSPNPALEAAGYQVLVVDYDDHTSLQFALQGCDLVISTIPGISQINLIDAAARVQVRRFVPSEFEGPPTLRPYDDPFDNGRAASLERLREHTHSNGRNPMLFTTFTCGIFYERFSRGGLMSKDVGLGSGLEHPGSYLLDIEHNTAEYMIEPSILMFTILSASNPSNALRLTSMSDVAKFVAAAVDLGINSWPPEFRMSGDRKTVMELIEDAEAIKGAQFHVVSYTAADLEHEIHLAMYCQDHIRVVRLQAMAATANRHYDFSEPTLNHLVGFQPIPFRDWLRRQWGGQ